jgi:hypothetical protein
MLSDVTFKEKLKVAVFHSSFGLKWSCGLKGLNPTTWTTQLR